MRAHHGKHRQWRRRWNIKYDKKINSVISAADSQAGWTDCRNGSETTRQYYILKQSSTND